MKYYTLKCVPGSVRPEKKNTAENILPEDELKIAHPQKRDFRFLADKRFPRKEYFTRRNKYFCIFK